MDDRLSIGEVAARAGVNASALRFYEAKGLLPAPERVSGRRVYEPSVLKRVAVIHATQQAGFSLKEIKALLAGGAEGEPRRWRQVAERKIRAIDELIGRAGELRRWLEESLACDCISLEECRLVDLAAAEPAPRISPLAEQMSPLHDSSRSVRRRRPQVR